MPTEQDVTADLRAAFRSSTHDVTYSGRRRPPRRANAVLLPLTAAGLAASVILATGLTRADETSTAGPRPSARATPSASPSSTRSPAWVTEEITLSGMTVPVRYQYGAPVPRQAVSSIDLPPGARPLDLGDLDLKDPRTQAWVGKDPETGGTALYLRSATRNREKLVGLLSSRITLAQLARLLRKGDT